MEVTNNADPAIAGIHWTNMTGSNKQLNLTTDIQNEITALLTCILSYLKSNFNTEGLNYQPASKAERNLIQNETSILREYGFVHIIGGLYRYKLLDIKTIGGNDSNIKDIISVDSDSGTATTITTAATTTIIK